MSERKNIVVTGANGFLGRNLVKRLTEQGDYISCLIRENKDHIKDYKNVNIINADLTLPLDAIKDKIKNSDCLFHLAAIPNLHDCLIDTLKCFNTNALATLNLLEILRKADIKKLIFTSSCSVYGNPQYMPIDEKHTTFPLELFSATKLSSENLILSYSSLYGIKSVIFRIFNLYGPLQEKRIIPFIIHNTNEGKPIEMRNGSLIRDFIYVDDTVDALIKSSEKGEGIYNLGSGSEINMFDLAKKIFKLMNKKVELTSKDDNSDIEVPRSCADLTKIKKELGWKPKIDLDEGITRTIDSFIGTTSQ